MRAVSEYASYVRQACESEADAVVVGAGLPLDLPELTSGFPKTAIIPILSDVRGIGLILKKWMRKNRLPDAIVIENPKYAAGHLGAPNADALDTPNFADRKSAVTGKRGSIRDDSGGGRNNKKK